MSRRKKNVSKQRNVRNEKAAAGGDPLATQMRIRNQFAREESEKYRQERNRIAHGVRLLSVCLS